ncbi:MAG: hypothetical protein M3347_01925 [Armatimonadota bacterium]|nr:hypothetical protein [Armatimonadota bacterium]
MALTLQNQVEPVALGFQFGYGWNLKGKCVPRLAGGKTNTGRRLLIALGILSIVAIALWFAFAGPNATELGNNVSAPSTTPTEAAINVAPTVTATPSTTPQNGLGAGASDAGHPSVGGTPGTVPTGTMSGNDNERTATPGVTIAPSSTPGALPAQSGPRQSGTTAPPTPTSPAPLVPTPPGR